MRGEPGSRRDVVGHRSCYRQLLEGALGQQRDHEILERNHADLKLQQFCFGVAPLILDDDAAFNMGGFRLEEARAKFPRLRDLSRQLAGLNHYAGRQLIPLATQFRVSKEALAIRLEELDLIAF